MALSSGLLSAFGSPIFRVLGFEYSAISALLLSVSCGFLTASRTASRSKRLVENAIASLILWSIPLLISSISLVFVSNCAYWEGLLFYVEIALPTTILAVAFGTSIGLFAKTRLTTIILFALFWLMTFVISLMPGYIFPQLFTYGWQYGFFPGLIWDDYIEISTAYRWHLLEWAMLASLLLMIVWPATKDRKWFAKVGIMALVYVGLLLSRSENGVVSSHAKVERALSSEFRTRNAIVHYYAPSLSLEERDQLKSDIDWYTLDIRRKLLLSDTERIAIYLYPDVESLYELVGTRNASIAKPWLRELHIAKENLHSLRHELVHVLVREWGSFPFYASFSTALTEGIAMAIEPNYDGIHILHEHASTILRMKLSGGVRNIMGFSGFASGASTTSYVLAGSFTQYLLDRYSVNEIRDVYNWPDFEAAYKRPLEELEREWKAEILQYSESMDRFDTLRTEYYFKRTSIINEPCLRHIGELNHHARQAMRAQRFDRADSLYWLAYQETGSLSAFRGSVNAKLRARRFDSARGLLDKSDFAQHPQRLALFIMKGDLFGDNFYDTLTFAELSRESVLLAFARKCLLADRSESDRHLSELYTYDSPLRQLRIDPNPEEYYPNNDSLSAPKRFAQAYLSALAYREEGLLNSARYAYAAAARSLDLFASTSELLDLLELELIEIGGGLPLEDYQRPGMKAELLDARARERESWSTSR
jgi:hypothetical protein